ncbi:MAG: hypothetical protein PHT59_07820 [Candidatus Omnitrophica bacterium]|nr:hypothetical protein [Candidatus Omnitrophota bacterium]
MTDVDPLTTVVTAVVTVVAVYFGLTAEQTTQVIAAIIAIVGAFYAWYQTQQKAVVVAALTSGTTESQTPAIVAKIPSRTWKMSDETKYNLVRLMSKAEQDSVLKQIADAEAAYQTRYRINFDGGFVTIEYGLIVQMVGNPSEFPGLDGSTITSRFYQDPRTGQWYATVEQAKAKGVTVNEC